MPAIPKNNLKEQMLKLNYNPNLVKLTAPKINYVPPPQTTNQPAPTTKIEKQSFDTSFQPPPITNIEEWSDFEDE